MLYASQMPAQSEHMTIAMKPNVDLSMTANIAVDAIVPCAVGYR